MRRVAWLVPAILVAATGGCGGDDARGGAPVRDSSSAGVRGASPTETIVRDTAETYDPRRTKVYRCIDTAGVAFRFEVRPRDGRVELWLPERFDRRTVELGQVRAASGARYEGDDAVFWSRGDEALLRVGPREYRGCTMDRGGWVWAAARRRGVEFRASGNEPGWYLELTRGDSLHLVYDYGEGELTVATPELVFQNSGDVRSVRFKTSDSTLQVTIDDKSCVAMSGTEFPTTVTVDVDGTSYRGCGRWLDGGPGQADDDSREEAHG
ncbi:MAG: MliC family protein [Candidatus Palauibacterales bacterium]|nr:MliC family protein [Candidatus Palauibacterales bacterium]